MTVLSVSSVSFGYTPGARILREVSLEIARGEFIALVGPNGSGKTTLLRLLDRILLPDKGSIQLDGKPLASYSRVDIARRIAFVPQDTGITFPFTVEELVLMGRAPHMRGAAFESKHDRMIADKVMEQTDIRHLAHQPVTMLSGGERQRVLIARAIAQEPRVILLDEPNAHLDIAHQLDVFRIIQELNIRDGVTVVAISHDLNLAATFSNRMGLLVNGALLAVGTPDQVLTEPLIRKAFHTDVLVDDHPLSGRPRITLA
jgi:iron complex transport system ATP-binding protein